MGDQVGLRLTEARLGRLGRPMGGRVGLLGTEVHVCDQADRRVFENDPYRYCSTGTVDRYDPVSGNLNHSSQLEPTTSLALSPPGIRSLSRPRGLMSIRLLVPKVQQFRKLGSPQSPAIQTSNTLPESEEAARVRGTKD
uniref:Uncharacterized protein n=1 Tax=Peronospora matthiolae TaxID=2874970 RepID=A0AAV1VIH2_9STRA